MTKKKRPGVSEAHRKIGGFPHGEFRALDDAYSKAHEKLRKVTADGKKMEAIDWQEPPRDLEGLRDALDGIEEVVERDKELRAKNRKASSAKNRKRREEAAERKKQEQKLADDVWRRNPGYSKNRIAQIIRMKIKGRPNAQSIARRIRPPKKTV